MQTERNQTRLLDVVVVTSVNLEFVCPLKQKRLEIAF